ncbi:histidine phosphatase superfamily [Mycena albidolilacea]|uniref:Histidine phosphatase superfamily n=1 Tax=Mycena albidolilacea TaxID=1033008 RepID=A0AAD7ED25_9AGAR|nr:histidine phosphatase superfamily [Mycena albidolilacea]
MHTAFCYTTIPDFLDGGAPSAVLPYKVPPRLGLIDDSPDRWRSLRARIAQLNTTGEKDTAFKLVFFTRHGQAIHDLGKSKYGNEAWDTYWSLIDGDEELIWGCDPGLTDAGKAHAAMIRDAWTAEIQAGLPIPESLYCSPLRRALETHDIIFGSLVPPDQRTTLIDVYSAADTPAIVGALARKYSPRSLRPPWRLILLRTSEELWQRDGIETSEDVSEQARIVLDRIFRDPATYIAVTAHGRIIAGFMRCLGVPSGVLPTDGIYSVLIKAVAAVSEPLQ